MVYIFWGEDDFSIWERVQEIRQEWDPTLLEVNSARLEGRSLSPEELERVGGALPFLSPRRLVLVFGLLGRFEATKEPAGDEALERWVGVIKGIPDSTVLILIEGKISSGNPLLKKLRPHAEVCHFPAIKGVRLEEWIRRRVARGGGKISPEGVRALAESVGENLWSLSHEIEKLLLYAGGRPITEQDVVDLVNEAREVNVFRLIDALLRGEPSGGRWLHRLLEEGEKPVRILFLLTRRLGTVVRAKDLLEQGLSLGQIQERLGLSEYPLRQAVEQARNFSWSRIREIYHRILEADLAIKSGRLGDELALDILLSELYRGRHS